MSMPSLATVPVRIARPSADLAVAERFWVAGVGLAVQWRTDVEALGPDDHELLMIGDPAAAWHLELVADAPTLAASPPGEEDLLVWYLGAPADPGWVARIVSHGGRVEAHRNPYWQRWGTTIVDPDGYRLVLSNRTWG